MNIKLFIHIVAWVYFPVKHSRIGTYSQ